MPFTIKADLTQEGPFGLLTALYDTGRRDSKRQAFWRCRCKCGKEIEARSSNLLSGNTTSCGCLKRRKRPKPVNEPGIRQCRVLTGRHYV